MFVERRWQPWWLLGLLVTIALSLAIAYGAAINHLVGWILSFLLTLAAFAMWFSSRSHVAVSSDYVGVGRMKLEHQFIKDVLPLDQPEFLIRIRSAARADDMFSLRGSSRGGIVISLDDPTDPYKAWVISSKNPQALAHAIELARLNVG